jgi:hypothetical protein
MFWLALLVKDTGIAASKRLDIKDEVVALDFDLAVSYRLFRLQIEEHKAIARRIAYEVSKLFGGTKEADDDDRILDAHELITGDKYANRNTQIW